MTDVHEPEVRSYNMSQIRRKDTKPEMIVRKFLFSKYITELRSYIFAGPLRRIPLSLIIWNFKSYLMIHKCKDIIEMKLRPDGFNIGMNCGEAAGQTVFQFHCNVVPRYSCDMKNPRGGIRHCVEGKGYFNCNILLI